MAEIVPDEGLDVIINTFFKNSPAVPANLYMGLFTGGTASTVPAASATLATPGGSFAIDPAYTSYARVAIPAANWGATGAKTVWSQSGRGSSATQVSMPAAGAAYATAINGFFIATVSSGTSGVVILWSNFDDTTAVASLGIGDQIKVTPTFALLN